MTCEDFHLKFKGLKQILPIIKGVHALSYDLVMSATDVTHVYVPKFTQVLADCLNLRCGKTSNLVLGPAHLTSLACVLTMRGLLDWMVLLGYLCCHYRNQQSA